MYQPKKEKIFNPFRIGKKENYVNDHELYELLRSRELFRLQLDLRKSLKIKLRGLANVQKVNMASLESRKRGFLQRVTKRNKPVLNVEEELEILSLEHKMLRMKQEVVDIEAAKRELLKSDSPLPPQKLSRERIKLRPSMEDIFEDSLLCHILKVEKLNEESEDATGVNELSKADNNSNRSNSVRLPKLFSDTRRSSRNEFLLVTAADEQDRIICDETTPHDRYKKLRQKRLQTLRIKQNALEQRVKNFSFSEVMSGYQSKR
ncbi:hypothetical protein SNE40_012252 [Patella caerulea]|uniref:Uncharacterized protein n=1 Tax=Patella caerulea TaxID=87958 RepID=A0AAN8JLG8_PATCE